MHCTRRETGRRLYVTSITLTRLLKKRSLMLYIIEIASKENL